MPGARVMRCLWPTVASVASALKAATARNAVPVIKGAAVPSPLPGDTVDVAADCHEVFIAAHAGSCHCVRARCVCVT